MPRPLTPALCPPDDIWHKMLGGLFSLVERAENAAKRKPIRAVKPPAPVEIVQYSDQTA